MQVGVPELELGLHLEPVLDNEQAVDDAGAMVVGRARGPGDLAGGFGSLDDGRCQDVGVRSSDTLFGQLAGDDGLDLVFEAEGYEGNLLGRNGGRDSGIAVRGEEGLDLIVPAAVVAVVPVEESVVIIVSSLRWA